MQMLAIGYLCQTLVGEWNIIFIEVSNNVLIILSYLVAKRFVS